MSRDKIIDTMVSNLLETARFWIRNGTAADEAFAIACSQSCAGPLPRRIAAEKLGL
jgi:hypothetical protein